MNFWLFIFFAIFSHFPATSDESVASQFSLLPLPMTTSTLMIFPSSEWKLSTIFFLFFTFCRLPFVRRRRKEMKEKRKNEYENHKAVRNLIMWKWKNLQTLSTHKLSRKIYFQMVYAGIFPWKLLLLVVIYIEMMFKENTLTRAFRCSLYFN